MAAVLVPPPADWRCDRCTLTRTALLAHFHHKSSSYCMLLSCEQLQMWLLCVGTRCGGGAQHRPDKSGGISRLTAPPTWSQNKQKAITLSFQKRKRVHTRGRGHRDHCGRTSSRMETISFVLQMQQHKKLVQHGGRRRLLNSGGTYTTHIPVMVKTGRLTGRIIQRDMMTAALWTTTNCIKDLKHETRITFRRFVQKQINSFNLQSVIYIHILHGSYQHSIHISRFCTVCSKSAHFSQLFKSNYLSLFFLRV